MLYRRAGDALTVAVELVNVHVIGVQTGADQIFAHGLEDHLAFAQLYPGSGEAGLGRFLHHPDRGGNDRRHGRAGARIQIASGAARIDIVMMGIITIGVLGFIFDQTLLRLEKRLTRWK